MSWLVQVVDWRGPSGAADVAAAFAHFSVQGNAASGGLPYWRQADAVSLASPTCPAGRAGPQDRVLHPGMGFAHPTLLTPAAESRWRCHPALQVEPDPKIGSEP